MSDVVGGDLGGAPLQHDGADKVLDPRLHARRKAFLRTFKVLATLIVVYFLILNIPGLRNAVDQLSDVKPGLLVLGLAFRPVSFLLAFTMAIAALHHYKAGDGLQGYGHALEAGIVFLALVLIGPGKYSVDGK